MSYMYISIENFLKVMNEEELNEFRIKCGVGVYLLTPLDKNGKFDNNLRNDLKYSITTEELEELLKFLNYDPKDKLFGFFKIDKSLPDNDCRHHLYKEVLN